jgi:XTP/dITP diphosphohydrolase
MKILIATNNQHKIKEINEIAKVKLNSNILSKIELISPKDLGINIEPKETFDTLEGNAKLKAEEFFKVSQIPTVADDSGLEIELLNNAPGVNSARFAEPHNDKVNRIKVLKLMQNFEHRNAKFRTVIALFDGNKCDYIIGEYNKKIKKKKKGENGFGYDSIFVPAGFNKTFAEMTDLEKNSISHRYKAVSKLLESFNSFAQ